ncbi:response regulator [Compostibacter hankyongensis]|uniref:Response regulator n=1 Tax=Compostibacter hankyongensis TaxID=1007089 RepID=A0ABP8FYW9_9BACT
MKQPPILIAEDDADDRFLLQSAFEEQGYKGEIQFVNNGVELLDHLSAILDGKEEDRRFPGLILLDLNMPKKDGREALQEIKQHEVLRKIPVIVFTTASNGREVDRCYSIGANSYLVKPVSFEGLLKVVGALNDYWFRTVCIPDDRID